MLYNILKTILILAFAGLLHAQNKKIEDSVFREIQEKGQAHVLITLNNRNIESGISEEQKTQRVVQLQSAFLNSTTKNEFQSRYQYQTIAGLSGILTEAGLQKLSTSDVVQSIQLDMQGTGGMTQSLTAIKADVAQSFGFTGKNVVVGVLDSGVNKNHPDLANAVVHEYHFLNQGQDVGPGAPDGHSHGTNVTGIIASRGTQTPIGVAPDAKIVAIRVLDSQNSGWLSDWIAGIDYIVSNNNSLNVAVINMSLVSNALYGGSSCDVSQRVFAQAALAAKNNGIIIFASSGNRGTTSQMTAPACLSDIVSVGATYDSDQGREPNTGTYNSQFGGGWPTCFNDTTSTATLACFTCRTASLDLVAPGAAITSTGFGTGTVTYRGTSQASPQAAGVAALLLEQNATLSVNDIKTRLTNGPDLVLDPATGLQFPFLNAVSALGLVTSVSVQTDNAPNEFSLEQNYPNPFNPTTTIKYSIKTSGFVSLKITNMLGQEIATLVSETKQAGEHKAVFNANALTSGLYLYRLQVNGTTATKKLLLLK